MTTNITTTTATTTTTYYADETTKHFTVMIFTNTQYSRCMYSSFSDFSQQPNNINPFRTITKYIVSIPCDPFITAKPVTDYDGKLLCKVHKLLPKCRVHLTVLLES